jgi:hypothetical protein
MCEDHGIIRITGFQTEVRCFSKMFILTIFRYIWYTNNDRNPRTLAYKPGSGQAVTG